MARELVRVIRDSRKNYIINGDMAIAQRGTSFAAAANNTYSLDRWRYQKSGAMIHTISQGTDVPTIAQAKYLFQNSYVATLTTPDTSIAASESCRIEQSIEGYNFVEFSQKTFTVSFWVKATLAGVYCVSARNAAADLSCVKEYTINTSNTWEYKTVTFPASPSSGTWDYVNGRGITVAFCLAAGSDFQTTAGSWQSGNFFKTSNQVNGVNTGATSFLITGVMLNEGDSAAPFRLFGENSEAELSACQRYYQKSMPYATPAQNNTGVRNGAVIHLATVTGPITFQFTIPFATRLRANPTISFFGIHQANSNFSNLSANNDGGTGASFNGSNGGDSSFAFGNSGAFNTSGVLMGIHWSADAEL